MPAREIRLKKGERLRAELTNAMPQDVTVHWHGIALVNDMDGVPDLTQAAVPNGQKFTYDFVVPDAGTYWFHSHVGAQLDRGLYGPLIIEDPTRRSTTTTSWCSSSTIGSTAPAPTRTRSSKT